MYTLQLGCNEQHILLRLTEAEMTSCIIVKDW